MCLFPQGQRYAVQDRWNTVWLTIPGTETTSRDSARKLLQHHKQAGEWKHLTSYRIIDRQKGEPVR